MDSHNFSINTGWEKFDRNGRLIDTEWDQESKTKIEGQVQVSLNGKIITSQPMESFCVRLFHLLCCGGRIFGSTSNSIIGTGSNSVMINETRLQSVAHPNVSHSSNVVFEQFIEHDNEIEAVFSIDIHLSSNLTSWTIAEVGLPTVVDALTNIIAARDVLNHTVSIQSNSILKIKWHLHFPETASKILTRNLLNNIAQACAPNFPNFKNINGTAATGDRSKTQNTFTKDIVGSAGNTGTANVSDKGIVVGTDGTVKDWNAYSLTLPERNTLAYSAMASLSNDSYQLSPDYKTAWYTVSRDVTNVSLADITLREAGLIAKPTTTDRGINVASSYLLARWLIGDVTLKPSDTLRVYFQPKITC